MRWSGGAGWSATTTRIGRYRPEIRERILENGLRAPSGGFSQGWAFLTLEGDDRERYWRIAAENADEKYVEWLTGLRRAPLLILAFAHKDAYLDRYAERGQGLDRSRRGPLDGAVLVRRHRDGGRC